MLYLDLMIAIFLLGVVLPAALALKDKMNARKLDRVCKDNNINWINN